MATITADVRYHKMRIPLDPEAQHGCAGESLWVIALGADRYRLDNEPFVAKGLHWSDVVVAVVTEDGWLTFQHVVERQAGATFRVYFPEQVTDNTDPRWQRLKAVTDGEQICREGVDGFSVLIRVLAALPGGVERVKAALRLLRLQGDLLTVSLIEDDPQTGLEVLG